MKALFTVWVLFLASSSAYAAGDVTPAMAKETMNRIKGSIFIDIPYMEQVLTRLDVRRANVAFLSKYGSSMGIYYQRVLYLNEDIFEAQGLKVEGSNLGVIAHEAWHAYYDQLLDRASRASLERTWVNYYSQEPGTNASRAIWIGDEAIGNYAQGVYSLYGMLVKSYLKNKTLRPTILKLYKDNYDGVGVRGYDADGNMSTLDVSAPERALLLRLAPGAIPPPDQLLAVLKQRTGQ